MSSVKRAKWIEGITQSKRILRDFAEIVTTAIQDEDGVVSAENWELVYPRPFKEYPTTRARMIKDPQDSRKYIPVKDNEERIRLTATSPIAITGSNIVVPTLKVTNEDRDVTYKIDVDYKYDAAKNTLARLAGGKITDGETVIVSYGMLFNQILDTVSVKVEEILQVKEPDREILSTDYVIDYANNQILFGSDPPIDAEYFSLTFTERTGTFTSREQTLLKLEKELLDPLGRTFKVSPTYGPIMKASDTRAIGESLTGGKAGTGEVTYEINPTARTVTFATKPNINPDDGDVLWYKGQMFNADKSKSDAIMTPLAAKIGDSTGTIFNIVGSLNELNDGQPHAVLLQTENTKPILYKRLSDLNAGYEVQDANQFVIDYKNPSVRFYEEQTADFLLTFTARDAYSIKDGLDKIKDRIVLKTRTTPEYSFDEVITNNYGATDTAEHLDMYVEITKPAKLVNPETGLERYVDYKGLQRATQTNNHYINSRMFDRWDDALQKPQDPTYNAKGELLDKGAYISDWSKYAWFQDWKEYLVDEVDDDPGSANINEGIIFQEVETQGMSEEFPIQFWITTNNNRIAVVLMGDPTLDQDNFLTSFAYFGRIHPFYDEECKVKRDETGEILFDANNEPIIEEVRTYFQNDVAGNFALTTGSSTLPSIIGAPPKGQPIIESVAINTDGAAGTPALVPGNLYDYTAFSYIVTYLTEVGESKPTNLSDGRIIVEKGLVEKGANIPKQGFSMKLRFHLPDEATGYRIYRFHDASKSAFGSEANLHTNYKLLSTVEKLDRERTIEFIDNGIVLPMYSEQYDSVLNATTAILQTSTLSQFYSKFVSAVATARAFESVTRDIYTGAILDVKFSNKWGKETATGVSEISMFQTRSGLKYQKHYPSFITTEEFMRKEKSGQSRWTGKFHLSPIYIEHSYDKQRGWFDGVMAVDDSGIEHLDELIVDKDTAKEEVYKFFRVSAPYSFFNNSPNYAYGLALIKSSMKWK